ncbi:unnamed protein product [Didymodactylos carnosus]|uniref:Uncharacterized protein n=1 Tax=Didymodactylos carnosus TaxID=1234261 RepID=A0A814IM44_9BILA|nr:unnamed protein product [Didymodactylos carnosus]CAF1557918.1 unnamed protein product [Didymodactylos carnosus]CAF3796981.1 unnamed protein product [Didymodactylos carnosus]CAF4349282.1 unnamed protein product [Didymodactylos carnosus]
MAAETIVKDSQIKGFSSFTTRIGYCCCKLIRKGEKYNFKTTQSTENIVPNAPKGNIVLQNYSLSTSVSADRLQTVTESTPRDPSVRMSKITVRPTPQTPQTPNRQQPFQMQQRIPLGPSKLTQNQITDTKKDPDETTTGMKK